MASDWRPPKSVATALSVKANATVTLKESAAVAESASVADALTESASAAETLSANEAETATDAASVADKVSANDAAAAIDRLSDPVPVSAAETNADADIVLEPTAESDSGTAIVTVGANAARVRTACAGANAIFAVRTKFEAGPVKMIDAAGGTRVLLESCVIAGAKAAVDIVAALGETA